MKLISGGALLTLVMALPTLVHAAKADADMAAVAAIPNLEMMQHAFSLTDHGPGGGWKAYGGAWGRRKSGGGSGGGSIVNPLTCTYPEEKCGNNCVDVRDNVEYCGDCDTECPLFGTCYNGKCECPDELACESDQGICVDPLTTQYTCGKGCINCGYARNCVDGNCECPTDEDPDWCSQPAPEQDICTDFTSDNDNCGTCGFICPQITGPLGTACYYIRGQRPLEQDPPVSPYLCNGGGSLRVCGFDLITGGGQCVDLNTDENNCGSCGNVCLDTQFCNAGSCSF